MTYHNNIFLFSVHLTRCTFMVYLRCCKHHINNPHCKTKNVDFDDRGAFNMFQELLHSWVGYKLVNVLLNSGLSPKIWQDLEDWSPDLFNLFSYLGDKQWDPSKKEQAEHLLTILFDRTLHNGNYS